MTTARKSSPRKSAPRKAAPRKSARRNSASPADLAYITEQDDSDSPFDLASILATDAAPLPITLLGVTGHVRRAYSGIEVLHFSALTKTVGVDGVLLELLELMTDVGPELWARIGELTPQHGSEILNKIVEMTGLHQGKLFAPLPSSPPPRVGEQSTPASGASTA